MFPKKIKLELTYLIYGFFIPFNIYSDLSNNALTTIGRKTFKGAASLRSLQLDNNEIMCTDEQAFKGLAELEIL